MSPETTELGRHFSEVFLQNQDHLPLVINCLEVRFYKLTNEAFISYNKHDSIALKAEMNYFCLIITLGI